MNKNFISIKATIFGFLVSGALVTLNVTNNPQLDLYTNYSVGKSKHLKEYDCSLLESNFSTITSSSVLSAINNEDELVLKDFVGNIVKNSKPLDSDFATLIDDNFWDLV